jgi:hypothetical protein
MVSGFICGWPPPRNAFRQCLIRSLASICDHQLPGDAGHLVGQRHGDQLRRFALEKVEDPGRPASAASNMLDYGGGPMSECR